MIEKRTGEAQTAEALTTVRDLAERLGISYRTVQRRLKAAGIVPVRTALGIPRYPEDTAERIAEPQGAAGDTALATTAAAAVAAALDHIRAGYEAALAAERARADAVAAERDRLAAAHGATITELRGERDRLLAQLAEARRVPPAAVSRPWWRFWEAR